jgi:Protein of unknown function (DUF1822)
MNLDLMPITQLVLPIPDEINQAAWTESGRYRSADVQWNIYLNQIVGQTLLPYLREDFPDMTLWQNIAGAAAPMNDPSLLSIWQFVSGTVLELNHKRLVLIPDKSIDQREWVIPAEWVDIPDWAGDYFLPVQIDPDEQLLHCWGYLTHQKLKAKGHYAPDDRTYQIDAHDVIPDISALWVVQQLNPTEVTQAAIAPLPTVAPAQAEQYLQQLVSAPIPRLAIPFESWGALVSDRAWRQRLAALRQETTTAITEQTTVTAELTTAQSTTAQSAITQLNTWMQNVFTTGWQAIEDFLGDDPELAFAFRQTTAPAIPTVRRVKALRLPEQLLLLLLTVEQNEDGRMGVEVQLRVADSRRSSTSAQYATIPVGLNLALVTTTGTIVQSVQARQADNAIQLSRFRSAPGTQFKIQVRLPEMPATEWTFSESFMV